MKPRSVLFICTKNSARSQMAEGLLRSRVGERFVIASAGLQKTTVHPLAVAAMQEIGIDIGDQHSKSLDDLPDQPWDYAITVCDLAKEKCPTFSERRSGSTGTSPIPRSSPAPRNNGLKPSAGHETSCANGFSNGLRSRTRPRIELDILFSWSALVCWCAEPSPWDGDSAGQRAVRLPRWRPSW
jgi:protein-tyrosine-phosphatase